MASRPKTRGLPQAELMVLRAEIQKAGSQVAVAKALGVSASTVSNALSGAYVGDVDSLAKRIRGAFTGETVRCPVMGDLGLKHCLDYQARPLAFTNPLRPRLWRACQTCPNRKGADRGEPT
jgi:hypothetical protein